MDQRKSVVSVEAIMRRCSALTKPSAIVLLDESNIILVDKTHRREHHDGNGENDAVIDIENPPLVHATSSCEDLDCDGLQEPLLQTTEAYPVSPVSLCEAESSFGRAVAYSDTVEAVPVGHTRSEFIFVKVNKPSPDCKLGIFLKGRRGEVCISRINPAGLFGKCPLEEGDVFVAINGFSCKKATPKEISNYVRAAKDTVSILVRNKNGNPQTASSTIQKSAIDSKVGIAMKDKRGAIVVSRVHEEGSFAGSLLMPGHRIVEINGHRCELLRPMDAFTMIRSCPDFVTVVSRPTSAGQDCAVVLSCEMHASWWRNVAIAGSLAVGAITVAQSLT